MFFFFNDTATTEIYTLSLHDALPIFCFQAAPHSRTSLFVIFLLAMSQKFQDINREETVKRFIFVFIPNLKECVNRSEEHTSELQSRQYLVCRLLLEKKIIITIYIYVI